MTTLREPRRLRLTPELVKTVHRRVSRRATLSRDSVARTLQRLVARATPLRWTTALDGGSHGVYRAVLRDRPVEIHVDPDDVDRDGVVVDVRVHTPPVEEELVAGTFRLEWHQPRALTEAARNADVEGGLYLMERDGRPIYVGQSTTLRARLRQHASSFQRVLGPKLASVLVWTAKVVRTVDVARTKAEREAQRRNDLLTVERVVIRYLLGKRRQPVPAKERTSPYHADGVALHNATAFQAFAVPARGIHVDLGAPRPPWFVQRNLKLETGSRYEL